MPEILTDEDVATMMGCELRTVREKIASGELHGVRWGTKGWRIVRDVLIQDLAALSLLNANKDRLNPKAVAHPTPAKPARKLPGENLIQLEAK